MENLEDRFNELEERVSLLEEKHFFRKMKGERSTSPSVGEAKKIQEEAASEPAVYDQDEASTSPKTPLIFLWLKDNWLTAIGIFFVLTATSWFIGYAVVNDWIDEKTRVLIGMASGIGIYTWGFFHLRKDLKQGQILVVLGKAIFMLALYGGYHWYALFNPLLIFSLMAFSAFITAFLALQKNLEGLGFASIFSSMILPILIFGSKSDASFIMNYVLLMDGAALGMLLIKGWARTFTFAWMSTIAYSFVLQTIYLYNEKLVYLFIALFYLVFFLPVALSNCNVIKREINKKISFFILMTTNLFLFFSVQFFCKEYWDTFFYSGASFLSLVCSYLLVFNWDKSTADLKFKRAISFILSFTALFFAFLAINSLNLSTEIKAIACFALGLISMGVSYLLLKSEDAPLQLSLFLLIPLYFLLEDLTAILSAPIWSREFALLLTGCLSFPSAAWIVSKLKVREDFLEYQVGVLRAFAIFTLLLTMVLIWNVCYNITSNESIGRGLALILYTCMAEGFIYIGSLKKIKELRVSAFAIIIFVICRLYFKEIEAMPVLTRIVTFVITGFLLIATAWLDKKSAKATLAKT